MKLIYQNLRLYFFSGCKFKQIIVNHNTLYVIFLKICSICKTFVSIFLFLSKAITFGRIKLLSVE